MRKREMVELLKEAGFALVRANRHEIWKRGPHRIAISRGNTIEDGLSKAIRVQIKRALEKDGVAA